MAMRIIAGSARGRQILSVPKNMMVKPISGRMRQSMFDILRPRVPSCRMLDLFAGTGAVGLEALSRGAERVVFVERDPRCLKVIERNLERFGWAGKAHAARGNALDSLSWVSFRGGVEKFDIVFLGPPYRDEENNMLAYTRPVLENLVKGGVLEPDAWVVAQHHQREKPGEVGGLRHVRQQRYGDTLVDYYRPAAHTGE